MEVDDALVVILLYAFAHVTGIGWAYASAPKTGTEIWFSYPVWRGMVLLLL